MASTSTSLINYEFITRSAAQTNRRLISLSNEACRSRFGIRHSGQKKVAVGILARNGGKPRSAGLFGGRFVADACRRSAVARTRRDMDLAFSCGSLRRAFAVSEFDAYRTRNRRPHKTTDDLRAARFARPYRKTQRRKYLPLAAAIVSRRCHRDGTARRICTYARHYGRFDENTAY